MTDQQEHQYQQGERAVWRKLLRQCLRELGYPEDLSAHKDIAEREEAIATIRTIVPDDDFPNDMHLSDILRRYVAPLCEQPSPPPTPR